MTQDQLSELYQKYLHRQPLGTDTRAHLNKSYEAFERELSSCEEYLRIQGLIEQVNNTENKIAILLSGHIRGNAILDALVNKLKKYNFDVFIHTWDNFGFKGKETNLDDKTSRDAISNEVKKIPNVRKLLIENNKQFIKKLPQPEHTYFNFSSPEPFIKSQLYSIHKSHELMEEYKRETGITYKAVFKFRFDTRIDHFSITPTILEEINNHDIIFTSDDGAHIHHDSGSGAGCMVCNKMYYDFKLRDVHVFEHSNIICDFYAYGSEKAMKTYCSMHSIYESYIKKYEEINFKSLEKFKNNLKQTDNGYTLKIKPGLNQDGHIKSFYYFYCSYPERILKDLLKDYMVIKSIAVKAKHIR